MRAVTNEAVKASLTRMDLFDKLGEAEPPIIRGGTTIMKCMEDIVDGFTVGLPLD